MVKSKRAGSIRASKPRVSKKKAEELAKVISSAYDELDVIKANQRKQREISAEIMSQEFSI